MVVLQSQFRGFLARLQNLVSHYLSYRLILRS
ncbi:hypothetical protein CE154_011570 [Alicycliphilus denitrificans]|uniref:Uncharacterized protein n=1 Tax=Alicycliphilus denitrificans TaxID=179636 RepID=A0A420KC01_9BURK|nr:hypothetical protein CE154_011570 [Alicycliphilus denitrificans]